MENLTGLGMDLKVVWNGVIFFDWEQDGETDHVRIVQKCENGTVYTVEGNSGDTCRTKTYPVRSSNIYGYGITAY